MSECSSFLPLINKESIGLFFPGESGVDQLQATLNSILKSTLHQKQLKFRRLMKVLWWLSLVMILVATPSWIMKHGFGSVSDPASFLEGTSQELEDLIGYDLAVVVSKEFATAFPDRTFISPVVDLLIKNERNVKTMERVYVEKGSKPKPDNMVLPVIEESRKVVNLMPQGKTIAMTDEEILEMVLFPVVKEACHVLEEKIVVKASDLDIAFVLWDEFSFISMLLGVNTYTSLEEWSEKYGNFYKPSRFLEERAINGVPLSAPINTGSRARM
ncbi:hypothetical protein Lser_V15G18208 [Lactuca serriola]